MYQQLILVGNLGGQPELRYTPTGTAFASFSMACSQKWTTQDGEKRERTVWFRVTAWQRKAELVSQYLGKGSKVMVIGEVQEARPYTDRDGNQRASLEVTAHEVRFLDNRSDAPGGAGASGGGQRTERRGLDGEPMQPDEGWSAGRLPESGIPF